MQLQQRNAGMRASSSVRQQRAPRPAPRARVARVAASKEGQKDGYKVLIVGGGSAGATVAAHYARRFPGQVAVVEPSSYHYYQPLWTLVGGGFKDVKDSRRPMGEVLPKGADWLHTSVTEFDPNHDSLMTSCGRRIKYDYLVVAAGIQAKWGAVKGLPEALGDGHVVSNMSFATAPLTWKTLQGLKEGRALFTLPKGVIKCPGAGHKVCYISEDYLRREGRRPAVDVTLCLAGDKVFGVPRYAATISNLVQERDINVKLNQNLVEVHKDKREAVFDILGQMGNTIGQEVLPYDFLHVTPPQGPFDFLAHSPLVNAEGWVNIDPETMQHKRYANVFSLGDCAAVPTSRTAAAAAAQFLVLRDNLDALMAGQLSASGASRYDGYSSCPLVTKKGATMFMEFGYNGKILETFTPFGFVDQSKEDFLMWLVKTEALPWAYWNFMVNGYVPWGEYKNALKHLQQRVGQSGQQPAPAAAPPAPAAQQPPAVPEPTRR